MTPIQRIRAAIVVVIAGLVLSGVTAFPLLHELNLLCDLLAGGRHAASGQDGLANWLLTVREGLDVTYRRYPFIGYGTDWLAFAHLMIALFFILPWRDPLRYEGVLKIGIACSLLILPLALICGPIRGIPLGWRLIDCSFGLLCLPPLIHALREIRRLREHME